MLGIRQYQAVAIDLFVGHHQDFAADKALPIEELSAAEWPDAAIHLGIQVADKAELLDSKMTLVKELLDQSSAAAPRRVTFILPDLLQYQKAQAVLFKIFPEK